MRFLLPGLSALIAAICGAAIGILFTVAHGATMAVGPIAFPYGIVLGFASVGAYLVAMRLLWDTRVPAIGGAIGVVGALLVLAVGTPAGAVVLASDAFGWTWAIGATAIAALAVAWPRRVRRSRPEGRDGQEPTGGEDTIEAHEEPAEDRL